MYIERHAQRTTVELVFGQIKQGGCFRNFLLRGLEKVRCEWSLVCAAHNLLKLFRRCRMTASPSSPISQTALAHNPGNSTEQAYARTGLFAPQEFGRKAMVTGWQVIIRAI